MCWRGAPNALNIDRGTLLVRGARQGEWFANAAAPFILHIEGEVEATRNVALSRRSAAAHTSNTARISI